MRCGSVLGAVVVILFMMGQTRGETGTSIPKEWKTFTAGKAFTFRRPPDLKEEKVQGIDSFVGKYKSPSLEVTFDYGWYSDPLTQEKYHREDITVDGKKAYLVTWNEGVGLHVPEVTAGALQATKLTMMVQCPKDSVENAKMLLRSVSFVKAETK